MLRFGRVDDGTIEFKAASGVRDLQNTHAESVG